jgi:formylglycine-generating enzyme required for sulfatase activity
VGSYTGSASPSGTFDQGGNVWEVNEAITGTVRGLRGGSWLHIPSDLAASHQIYVDPTDEDVSLGFRVAMIPEPTTAL